MIYLISDCHFSHGKIIGYCNRPFQSSEQMDDFMIRAWNEIVTDDDTIIMLGDFYAPRRKLEQYKDHICSIYNSLHGKKIFLKGNHDEGNEFIPWNGTELGMKYKGMMFYFNHHPPKTEEWPGYSVGSYYIHGHIHEKKCDIPRTFNVSVENINYMPIALDDIINSIKGLPNEV